jgi:hypothetical protein
LLEVGRRQHKKTKIVSGNNNTSMKEKQKQAITKNNTHEALVYVSGKAIRYPDRHPTPPQGAYLPHLTLELCFHGKSILAVLIPL